MRNETIAFDEIVVSGGFLNDDLLQEFCAAQGLMAEWEVKPTDSGQRALIKLSGMAMPPADAEDAQVALDRATIKAVQLLTRTEMDREPLLALV